MNRRGILAVLAGWALLLPATRAHTPYQQWVVYRRKHLLIGVSKANDGSYELGKNLTALLQQELPESRSRVARAPTQLRLASLLTTDQLRLILLTPDAALKLRNGTSPYQDYGPFELKLLADTGEYWLLASPNLPTHHAWLIRQALSASSRYHSTAEDKISIPYHPGAQAYLEGRAMPSAPLPEKEGSMHEHAH